MGAVAACTGQDDGGAAVGSDEINIIFPNGTLGPFEAGRVSVLVQCSGIVGNDFFGEDPADATVFETDLELVNTDPVTGMVWHTFYDVLGDCLFDVSVFEPDGELFCVGQGFQHVEAGDRKEVNVVVMCDVSQNIDTATLDFHIDTFVIAVGNFCPFLHSMETIPEFIPIPADISPIQIPNPAFDGSWNCASDANCVSDGMGLGCDNDTTSPNYLKCDPVFTATEFQVCGLDAADVNPAAAVLSSCGNRCDTADGSDPGNLSYQCTATLPDGTPSQGVFSDPANSGFGQDGDGDPTTYNGWCSNAAIPPEFMIQLPVSVGYFVCSDSEPGTTITLACCGGDGDEDCDKCITSEVTCAGIDQCEATGETCDDGNPCTANDCDPVDASCTNPADPGANGTTCTTNPGNATLGDGVCDASAPASDGFCRDVNRCDGVDCGDGNDCTQDLCDLADGSCSNPNEGAGTLCDSGAGICDGGGACVDNCAGVDCSDGNQCTDDVCDSLAGGTCSNPNSPAGSACDTCGASACGCDGGGSCEVRPPTYNLSLSVFKPYNGLLDETTGSGDPYTDCAVPDLAGNPGANLTGITGKCILIVPPDIQGFMVLNETSAGNFDVTIQQDLVFVIDVTIAAVNANVNIVTDSSTRLTNTGTGANPGTITLTPLTAPFNINAAATGLTVCTATNTATGDDVSDAICPLAGLMGGDNPLPFEGDPFMRTMPPINTTDTGFQMGGGPADATGWYLSNPAPLAGNGTQWLAYAGDLLP
jgi:hypothetical protein